MVDVTDLVITRKLKNNNVLELWSEWSRAEGATIWIFERDKEGRILKEHLVTQKGIPPAWHTGNFSNADVKRRFGPRFEKIFTDINLKAIRKRKLRKVT